MVRDQCGSVPHLIVQRDLRAAEGIPVNASPSVPSVRVLLPYLIWTNLPYWVRIRTVHYCSSLQANCEGLIFHFPPKELKRLKEHLGIDYPQSVPYFQEERRHRENLHGPEIL